MAETASHSTSAARRVAHSRPPELWTRFAPWVPLAGVSAVALILNTLHASENGFGNGYYAAAAKAMTRNLHNFFFVSFDPAGFISVDKPPVFLWIQATSVGIFGLSSWSLFLPSAIAGTASVALIWLSVRRYFGTLPATLAAMGLAVTPAAVIVNRLNMTEPFYVLALVGAAACTLRSLESNRWLAWTIAAGVLVGIAFNTKMLAGWIPGPAFALAIVVGVEGSWQTAWRDWMRRLAVLAVVTFAVSISWMMVVDLWPSSSRPYVGGSTNNTVRNLVLSYNGLERVELTPPVPEPAPGRQPPTSVIVPMGSRDDAGLLRLFKNEHGNAIAWLLPFALISGIVSLWRWRDDRLRRAATVVWLGWVLLFGILFSFQEGLYHSYYTAALVPGVAALVGMGVVAADQLASLRRPWLLAGLAMTLTTLAMQLVIAGRVDGFYEWLTPLTVGGVAFGLLVFVSALWGRNRLPAIAGLSITVAALLLLPAAWSSHETTHAQENTLIPLAGPRETSSRASEAGTANMRLLGAWLRANRDPNTRWDVVLTSAVQGSFLAVEYDLSVMAVGGFSGLDPTISVEDFADLVEAGKVRYVLVTDALGRFPPVGFTAFTPGVEAPRGADGIISAAFRVCQSQGSIVALFDCAGQAEALRASTQSNR